MKTLIEAARAIIHQRDHYADHQEYDTTQPRPDADQEFDDWAADILEQALDTEGVAKCEHDWGGEPSYGAECLLCGATCQERVNADGTPYIDPFAN